MGTELVVPLLGPPFLCWLAVLVALAMGKGGGITHPRTLGLGRERLAFGFLAAIAAVLLVSVLGALQDVRSNVASGWYAPGTEFRHAMWLSAHYLIVFGFLSSLLIAAFVLPLVSMLRRFRLASVAGVGGSVFILCMAASWLLGGDLLAVILATVLAVCFSWGARLPALASEAHRM